MLFTAFITNTINSPEWENRKAAVLSFGVLSETPDDPAVRALVGAAITEVTMMLKDAHFRVQKAVARILARVAENYPEAFLMHPNGLKILEVILEFTKASPKIAIHIMWTLSFLTESFQKFP